MMKQLSALVLCSFLALQSMAQDNMEVKPKLSPLTKKYILENRIASQKGEPVPGYIYKKLSNGRLYISALIKVAHPAIVQEAFNNMGVIVGTKAGNIWTVQVPIEKVIEFTNTNGIAYIQLDEPVCPNLDYARKTTRVDSVHKGYNLPMPYSGKNVVVGIIDFGFDYTHPTFYDTLGTAYRIKKVWELNSSSGTPPSGYTYGNEITDSNAIRTKGTDDPRQMHGTSVAGLAAGSGVGTTNGKLRGIAYNADLVLVGVRRDSIGGQWMQGGFSDFIDGVNYIFNHASSVSKPAVVNISWGSQSGAHDGTSLFNEACDNLSGPGKLVVMSAGNEGEEKIHIAKTFTATDTTVKTFITFTDSTYQRTWVDIWGEAGKTFCAGATLYKNGVAGNSIQPLCIDDQVHDMYILGSNGTDTCYVQFITSSAELNGKPRLTMNIFNKTKDTVAITVKGTNGTINMWDEYYYYGFVHKYSSAFDSLGNNWAVSGNTTSTASDMGAAKSVLLVGAYVSKTGFTDLNNAGHSYSGYASLGKLAPFSSHGPLLDGRIKPDITAPGITIATSLTSFDTSYTPTGSNKAYVTAKYLDPVSGKTYYYGEFIGTSASAPLASGIVALLLQAKPDMTPQELKNFLTASAIKDNYTGTIPAGGNNTWGNGKINAYGAIKLALQAASVYSYKGNSPDCIIFPNPNEGNFTIDYNSTKAEAVNIRVYNLAGSVVSSDYWNVSSGINRRQFYLSNLPKGTYLVQVANATGAVSIKTLIR